MVGSIAIVVLSTKWCYRFAFDKVVWLVCLLITHDFSVVQLVHLKKQSGVVGSQVSYHVYLTLRQRAQAQHRLVPLEHPHQHGPLHALSHSDDLK